MANFAPSKKTPIDFNNGEKYLDYNAELGQNGDELQAESINSVIEGLLYTQGLAVNAPDVSEANRTGTVEVSIITYIDGTARLKFKNLKGEHGVGIDTILSNGTDINGGNIYNIVLEDGRTYNFVAPKGSKGDAGKTPNISVTASVNNNIGTPSVSVTKGGTSDNPTFNFDFSNLKGAAGEPKTVLQETGQSTTAVMSQKAVTDALASKADKTQLQGLATEAYVDDEVTAQINSTVGNINSLLDAINGEVI